MTEPQESAFPAGSAQSSGSDQNRLDVPQQEIEILKKDLQDFKARIIETLAIFVAMFTFVSVDMQIFKLQISIMAAAGITLVLLAALLFFAISIHLLFNENQNLFRSRRPLFVTILVLIVLLIISGLLLFREDFTNYTKPLRENFYTKEELDAQIKDLQSSVNNLKGCLKDGGYYRCFNY